MSSMYGSERRKIRPRAAVKTNAMQIGSKFQGIPKSLPSGGAAYSRTPRGMQRSSIGLAARYHIRRRERMLSQRKSRLAFPLRHSKQHSKPPEKEPKALKRMCQ